MSASAEASELIKKLAGPASAGARVETLIGAAARKVGFSFRRARTLWYAESEAVRSGEMDALRAAAAARTEAEVETRERYRELIARIELLERRLEARRSDVAGE